MSKANEMTNPVDAVVRRWAPAYNAANLDVANAYGLEAGLNKIYERMKSRNDCPLWFIEEMDDCIKRANRVIPVLIQRRNDVA